MFILAEEIVRKCLFNHIESLHSIELIGEVRSVGHILINNRFQFPIFINNEEAIMDVLMDVMMKWDELCEADYHVLIDSLDLVP